MSIPLVPANRNRVGALDGTVTVTTAEADLVVSDWPVAVTVYVPTVAGAV